MLSTPIPHTKKLSAHNPPKIPFSSFSCVMNFLILFWKFARAFEDFRKHPNIRRQATKIPKTYIRQRNIAKKRPCLRTSPKYIMHASFHLALSVTKICHVFQCTCGDYLHKTRVFCITNPSSPGVLTLNGRHTSTTHVIMWNRSNYESIWEPC